MAAIKGYKEASKEAMERVIAYNKSINTENETCYVSIKTGTKTARFTLWLNILPYDGYRGISTYQGVLSSDFDKAVDKAIEYASNGGLRIVVCENEVTEYDYSGDIFQFGKYKGERIDAIAKMDIDYILFLNKKYHEYDPDYDGCKQSACVRKNYELIGKFAKEYWDAKAEANRASCTSEYVGEVDGKLSKFTLYIDSAKKESVFDAYAGDDVWRIVINAHDASGNRFTMQAYAGTKLYNDMNKNDVIRMVRNGDELNVSSCKVKAQFESVGRKTTRISNVRLVKECGIVRNGDVYLTDGTKIKIDGKYVDKSQLSDKLVMVYRVKDEDFPFLVNAPIYDISKREELEACANEFNRVMAMSQNLKDWSMGPINVSELAGITIENGNIVGFGDWLSANKYMPKY